MDMCNELFVNLLLAHVLGDFYCQTDKWCDAKRNKKFKSCFLYVHPIIIGVLSWLLVWNWTFAICALILMVSHLVIDAVKCFVKDSLFSFLVDQVLHIAVLIAVSSLWTGAYWWSAPDWFCCFGQSVPLVLTGVLILGKPANIFIKRTLEQYKITETGKAENEASNKVGSLIGTLERLLAFIFILIGEVSAVGFLLAAKSILRFRDSDTVKTEYVLAGTLLSFGIAVIVGLVIL